MKAPVLLYRTTNENVSVEVTFFNDNFWLTQKAMALLFDCSVDNISLHLKNIFTTGELNQNSVIEDFSTTAADGKSYKTKCYNLDAIIAVGYRVNSSKATQFRIWATQTLKEFIIKGFVLNDEMLKNGNSFGKDYLKNYSKKSEKSEFQKDVFTKKLVIFLLFQPIMIKMQVKPKYFLQPFKINYIGQFLAKPQPK